MAGEVEAADDDAARQEAAAGGHEVDGEPEDFTFALGGLCGPDGLAAGQAEHGALCPARGRQLVPGLGECALSQGNVLGAVWHGLQGDAAEVKWDMDQSGNEDLSEKSIITLFLNQCQNAFFLGITHFSIKAHHVYTLVFLKHLPLDNTSHQARRKLLNKYIPLKSGKSLCILEESMNKVKSLKDQKTSGNLKQIKTKISAHRPTRVNCRLNNHLPTLLCYLHLLQRTL